VTLQLDDLHPNQGHHLTRLRVRGKGDKERIVWLTVEVVHEIQQWLQQPGLLQSQLDERERTIIRLS